MFYFSKRAYFSQSTLDFLNHLLYFRNWTSSKYGIYKIKYTSYDFSNTPLNMSFGLCLSFPYSVLKKLSYLEIWGTKNQVHLLRFVYFKINSLSWVCLLDKRMFCKDLEYCTIFLMIKINSLCRASILD